MTMLKYGGNGATRYPMIDNVMQPEVVDVATKMLNAILAELGHHAEFIGQGEAAPERLEQGRFDAVLMDMVLPGINGVEAIRRIRALQGPLGRIPVIGISGRSEDEAASRAAGADVFLVKPVSPRALATALHEATRHGATATS